MASTRRSWFPLFGEQLDQAAIGFGYPGGYRVKTFAPPVFCFVSSVHVTAPD